MEKKTYIIPAMEEMNIETMEMLAGSPFGFYDETEVETDKPGVQGVIGRRGSWGNRWE